jgi:pyruvate/2-oxoglutarate dehydrogenase complex dihydrolipoamide dehydrogenase (E3) component
MATSHDVIIIGSGQAGGPLAGAFARAGRKVALVEREHVGGTCVNVGCTPTKTMVASARVAYLARRAADYGVQTGTVTVDLTRVRQRKRDIVNQFRSGSERRLGQAEVELVRGEGRFTTSHQVEVQLQQGGTRELTAPTILINTGARPARPPLPGLDQVPFLDSTSIMELDQVPDHLLVLGGGYIGLEFGQMFRRFGSRVTVVQRSEHLLSREDADVADEVARILREDGVDVRLQTQVSKVAGSEGSIRLTVQGADGEKTLEGSHLLLAVGRLPNTDHLKPSAAGVNTDARGFIVVDDQLRTNIEGLYALGDVKGGPAFTHISYDDYRIVKTNLLGNGGASRAGRFVPYTVYIDPQLGRVGLSEEQARKQGRNIRVAKMSMSYVARALETDEPRGLMKVVVDAESDQILGCAILGIEGGELMSMLQIAMMGQVPASRLREAIYAHPTLAEGLNTLFGMLG